MKPAAATLAVVLLASAAAGTAQAQNLMISGGTTIPCGIGGASVASINWCTNDTVRWGSCRLGTRGCC